MIARREGHIINMVSAGHFPRRRSSPVILPVNLGCAPLPTPCAANSSRSASKSWYLPGPASTEFGQEQKTPLQKVPSVPCLARSHINMSPAAWWDSQTSKRLIIPWQYHLTLPLDTFLSIPADWGLIYFRNSIIRRIRDFLVTQNLSRQTYRLASNSNPDAVILNPGPTLKYLTGINFHLMERPVVYSLHRAKTCACPPGVGTPKTGSVPIQSAGVAWW